jgi:hypothetical protein
MLLRLSIDVERCTRLKAYGGEIRGSIKSSKREELQSINPMIVSIVPLPKISPEGKLEEW